MSTCAICKVICCVDVNRLLLHKLHWRQLEADMGGCCCFAEGGGAGGDKPWSPVLHD